ncbi:MAG: PRC-barrel domain-containing protein [Chitinophagaceae bacterium]
MHRNLNSLIGYSLEATDGRIGEVDEFYFDDHTWTIRYLILKTGNWLDGRRVLISPEALEKAPWKSKSLPVKLSREQIRNSPPIDTEKPVSRQQEMELYEHYSWPNYWGSGWDTGDLWGLPNAVPLISPNPIQQPDSKGKKNTSDPHLRSTFQVTGYGIHATDGEIGHIKDYIIDDQNWRLLYLIVDTHNWFGGKKVLIAVRHIREVQWPNSKVMVDVPIAAVENSQPFEESAFIDQDQAGNGLYDQPPYI